MKVITQTRLIPSTPIAPRPLGSDDYVPVLFAKEGEMEALRHVDDGTRERLCPLVQVVTEESPAPPSTQVRRRIRTIAQAAQARPVYLEMLRTTKSGKLIAERDPDVILQAFADARSEDLPFIPVVRASELEHAAIDAITDSVHTDGRGAAIRYHFLTLIPPPPRSPAEMLCDACAAVDCSPDNCDLLLDMDILSPFHDYPLGDLAASINELIGAREWRSVVLLGSSMPGSFDADVTEGEVTGLTRLEWTLWKRMGVPPLARHVTFGDYGVQGPRAPAGGSVKNMRASVRYTAGDKIYVARGTGPIEQLGREQYRALCRRILELDEFSGEAYSHGDQILSECARGLRPLGRQSLWREAATSHHLTYVVDQMGAHVPPERTRWFDTDDYVLGRF